MDRDFGYQFYSDPVNQDLRIHLPIENCLLLYKNRLEDRELLAAKEIEEEKEEEMDEDLDALEGKFCNFSLFRIIRFKNCNFFTDDYAYYYATDIDDDDDDDDVKGPTVD